MLIGQTLSSRKQELFAAKNQQIVRRAEKIFLSLLIFQGLLVCVLPPLLNFLGISSLPDDWYWSATAGILLASAPAASIIFFNGHEATRTLVVVSQIFFSILWAQVTSDSRVTQDHVFVSLAFLALYNEERAILAAVVIAIVGSWAIWSVGLEPQSVSTLLEQNLWQLIEVGSIILVIRFSRATILDGCQHQAEVEYMLATEEKTVEIRTRELSESRQQIFEQQEALIAAAKMSSLGEMAAGIAHEINNPLTIIRMLTESLSTTKTDGQYETAKLDKSLPRILTTVDRIATIVLGLRTFARDGSGDKATLVSVNSVIESTLSFCKERFNQSGIQIRYKDSNSQDSSRASARLSQIQLECRSVEISQVLLNLLNNSFDAIEGLTEKWIQIEALDLGAAVEIRVVDSGHGIDKNVAAKIMQPFFTTKEVGKGTGLGLSISRGIIAKHGGTLQLQADSQNTCFVIRLPKKHGVAREYPQAA